jgi:hypothetical protein
VQLTGKAYATLLEGPFADSILDSPFIANEYRRLKASSWLDTTATSADDRLHSLELLKKLEDRMEENRVKFPWKTLFSAMEDSDGYLDLV